MPDVQEAAPSAAPVVEAAPSYEIPRSGTPEYTEWRKSGALPEKKIEPVKQAEPTAADAPKEADSGAEEAEHAPDTDRVKTQEEPRIPKSRLDKEIAKRRELEARLAQIETERQKPTKADSSPASARQQAPQNYAEYRKAFKPSEFIAEYAKQNPDASYEDANAAMADHLLDVRDHFRAIEQRVNAERQALESKVSDARSRYEDFDSIKSSFLSQVVSEQGTPLIPLQVLGIINDSDVLPDLLYTIGSDEAEMQKFVEMAKTNPNKAIRYVARVEDLIQQELSGKPRNDKGQFAAKTEPEPAPTPAKRGPESAPEPPIEIGSRGSGPLDESDRSFKAIERGDARATGAWLEAENRRMMARRRGV